MTIRNVINATRLVWLRCDPPKLFQKSDEWFVIFDFMPKFSHSISSSLRSHWKNSSSFAGVSHRDEDSNKSDQRPWENFALPQGRCSSKQACLVRCCWSSSSGHRSYKASSVYQPSGSPNRTRFSEDSAEFFWPPDQASWRPQNPETSLSRGWASWCLLSSTSMGIFETENFGWNLGW